jgi:hypothetical protein
MALTRIFQHYRLIPPTELTGPRDFPLDYGFIRRSESHTVAAPIDLNPDDEDEDEDDEEDEDYVMPEEAGDVTAAGAGSSSSPRGLTGLYQRLDAMSLAQTEFHRRSDETFFQLAAAQRYDHTMMLSYYESMGYTPPMMPLTPFSHPLPPTGPPFDPWQMPPPPEDHGDD